MQKSLYTQTHKFFFPKMDDDSNLK